MNTRKQRNGYECGPVAVSNALTLVGVKAPSMTALKKLLRTNRNGTSTKMMKTILEKLHPNVIDYTSASTKQRREAVIELMLGEILVLGYYAAGIEGHYTVVKYLRSNGKFYAFNWLPDHLTVTESHSKMHKIGTISVEWIAGKLEDQASEIYVLRKQVACPST